MNGSFSRIEFSPWHVTSYDSNDTAFDPDPAKRSDWYKRRMDPTHPRFAEFNGPENVRAAEAVEMLDVPLELVRVNPADLVDDLDAGAEGIEPFLVAEKESDAVAELVLVLGGGGHE